MSGQLMFDFEAAPPRRLELINRRRMPKGGGPAKLLRAVIEHEDGVSEGAVPFAARLVSELHAMAAERRELGRAA